MSYLTIIFIGNGRQLYRDNMGINWGNRKHAQYVRTRIGRSQLRRQTARIAQLAI